MSSFSQFPRFVALVALTTLLAACQADRALEAGSNPSLSLTVVAGNDQRGTVGEPLSRGILVRLTRAGRPVGREQLDAQITAGGGQLVANSVLTDGDGRAALVWSLGTRAGEPQRLEIRHVEPHSGVVRTLATIQAEATAGAPAALVPLAPLKQRATLGAPVDSAPAVRVIDRYGNPVIGLPVAFSPTTSGMAVSDTLVRTDSTGIARLSRWSLLQPSARSELVVRATGSAAPVTFVASAFADIDLALLPPMPRLASGASHTCALDDKGKAYCWGDNTYSVLGIRGSMESSFNQSSLLAKSASPRLVDSVRTYAAVVSSASSACALEAGSGKVFCWGRASSGELGTSGPLTSSFATSTPVMAELPEPAVRLSAGGATVCALTAVGVAYCWGDNSDGQIGNGRYNGTRRTPAQSALGLRFVDISVGSEHTCGLRKDGSVYCWGTNEHFQLGWSGLVRAAVAAPQLDLPQVTSLSAGLYHTCALRADSTSVCWGGNFDGQLGDGTGWSSRVPVATIGGHRFTQIVAADGHSCGLRTDKRVFCWGVNDDGSLGDGTLITKVEPTPLSGAHSYSFLARRCAVAEDKSLWCWGPNTFWQTSFGTASTPRTSPVRVPLP